MAVLQARRACKHRILVETGTYLGDMAKAMTPYFHRMYTIELSDELHRSVLRELGHLKNIEFLLGDSARLLPRILGTLDEPIIFWLDGHYSGGITARGEKDTPIFEELNAIRDSKHADRHVIIIDDARLFAGDSEYKNYPTINEIERWTRENLPGSSTVVEYDAIIIAPI